MIVFDKFILYHFPNTNAFITSSKDGYRFLTYIHKPLNTQFQLNQLKQNFIFHVGSAVMNLAQ